MDLRQHLVCVLFLVSGVAASCDDIKLARCECKHPFGKWYEILCQGTSLTEMPPKGNKTLSDGYVSGNFSYNAIGNIPDFYFSIIRHFDSLDFTSNQIKKISDLTFRGLESELTSLNMSKNVLSSVPAHTFKKYKFLKYLDLSGNALASPCQIHTARVEKYSLANNAITRLTDQCFADSAEITELDLSGNRISQVDGGAFDGLDDLTTLRLANNQLSDIGDGFDALTDLTNFRYLTLAGNNFKDLSSVCKYLFPHITYMDFGYNKLTDREKYCFQFYYDLEPVVPLELNFEHNEITSLDMSDFTGLEKRLNRLRLNNNKITSINLDTFIRHFVLSYINLDNNRLTSLDFLREWQNNELVELSVTNNDISQLSSRDFVNMNSLVKLTLDGNRLLNIQSNTFVGLTALTHLSIKYNLITDLADHAFYGLDSLKSLKLSGNALVTLKNCTFGELVTLQQFHFEDNLLSCDCDLLWLWQYTSTVKERGMAETMEKPVLADDICRYPERLSGEHMQNKVTELCKTETSTACFGLETVIEEWGNGFANMTYSWDNALAGSSAKEIHIEQLEVKSGDVVYNETVTGSQTERTLEGFTDGNIFKVCTTVVLTEDRQQKSCAIWPEMIKKPTTPAPQIQTTTPARMHPGSQAAIALAVILIILIILLVLIGVYLWKTEKYRHVVPEQMINKFSKKSSRDSSSIEKSPETNGKADPLDFRPADETRPMMSNPRYTEHDL